MTSTAHHPQGYPAAATPQALHAAPPQPGIAHHPSSVSPGAPPRPLCHLAFTWPLPLPDTPVPPSSPLPPTRDALGARPYNLRSKPHRHILPRDIPVSNNEDVDLLFLVGGGTFSSPPARHVRRIVWVHIQYRTGSQAHTWKQPCSLHLGSLTAEPETRMWVRVVCVGGDLRQQEWEGVAESTSLPQRTLPWPGPTCPGTLGESTRLGCRSVCPFACPLRVPPGALPLGPRTEP